MAQRNPARLAARGPVIDENGFPAWFEDAGTLRLELGLDPADPNTPAMGDLPLPGSPVAFPANYPDEAFYLLVDAGLSPVGGTPAPGRARVVLALEAAFGGTGEVADGQQMVFARLRVRLDGGIPGASYVFTHPYGATEPLEADANGRVFVTEDVGAVPLDFDAAVRDGEVAPFLRWDTGAPAGYLGDGTTPHTITGSPLGFDFFRLEGPRVGDAGAPPDPADPGNINKILTTLFTVQGKIATRSGVEITRAVFERAGALGVDTFARSDPGQTLRVSGTGVPATNLPGTAGSYLARTTAGTSVPASVTVTNHTDSPPTTSTANVTDAVTVTTADYDIAARTLTVAASSSDVDGAPGLTAQGLGPLPGGSFTFTALDAPPATVRVTSTSGGEHTRHVLVTGPVAAPVPVTSDAGPDRTVVQGQNVPLAGSSDGTPASFTWTQDSGPAVTLADPAAASTTFTAPAAGSVLGFTLTVTGPGGPSTDTVTITVAALSAPVADAGPDRTEPVGNGVTLAGDGSTGAATFSWAQVSGPVIALTGEDTAAPTFVMPAGGAVVVRLTVTGPGGPDATDDVTVSPEPATVVVQRLQFRTSVQQWRVEGAATGRLPDQVTATFAGDVIGAAAVAADGTWDIRTTLSSGDGRPRPGPGATVQVTSSRGAAASAVVLIRN